MRYQLIVWDFDGTLADTRALALATYNDLAGRLGFLQVEDPASVRHLGTLAFLRQHRIPLYRLPRLVKDYLAATRGQMDAVRLFGGLPDVLHSLKASGCRLGVLSSNSADNIRSCLRANTVEDVFDFVVGYPRLFGKATALRRLLKQEKVEPQHFLYIGDELRDVEAAKRAGVDSAAAAWGFQSLDVLRQEGPTFLWSSPGDVLPALLSGPFHK
jgi:phosphoglycolate phosphatase